MVLNFEIYDAFNSILINKGNLSKCVPGFWKCKRLEMSIRRT